MADDCVCTNLISIYSVLNDIATSLKYGSNNITSLQNTNMRLIANKIDALATSIGTLNDVVSKLDELFKCNSVNIACVLKNGLMYDTDVSCLSVIHTDLYGINYRLVYEGKNIAEIWSYKEMCVSNETIVESPLSTFVSKAKLDIDE